MKQPTVAEMRRVLKRYGRRVLETEARKRPSTMAEVARYCEALHGVWELAKRIARTR